MAAVSRRRRRWLIALGALLLPCLALWIAVVAVPFPRDLLAPARVESRRLHDRHGRLLREALSDLEGRGAWRPLAEVSPWVPKAFIAIEDRRFHDHAGVDLRGIGRALRDNLRAGRVVAGGSTITQQVVRLVRPAPRSLLGKAREALWALRLERVADKAAVLEQYVNRAPFGHGAFGIEAAARLYLDKSARDLGLAEAALLAGIPRSPSVGNPFTDAARARRRMESVLQQMREVGFIDDAQLAEALADPIRIAPREHRFAAPHFASFVLARGTPPGDVHTTLDLDLQHRVEALVEQELRVLADRRVGQGAVVVLDNRTGEILAWVGSRDFFDPREGQVDMVLARRQPGSTLKPFVYSLGLEGGLSAATRLPDLPLFFPTALGDYRPRNYDRRFHGWVSLRAALANSYNVPAVWMAHRVGVARVLAHLRDIGFESLSRAAEHYGLGLALGNGEVRLLELANAYRALANEGRVSPVRWLRDSPPEDGRRVMPAEVARLLTHILADPVARIPAFGRHNALELPFPAAAKTGTSTDFTDNWTVGYSAEVTVGVWVGNFDGRPMEAVSGMTGAGHLWNAVLRAAMERRPGRPFSTAGLSRVRLCRDDGAPYDPDRCAHAIEELFVGEAPAAAPVAGPVTRPRLRVVFPDDGDVFSRDADTPEPFARLRLRAEAPPEVEALVWEIDGAAGEPVAAPFTRWWPAAPGVHRIRVWPAGAPAEASPPVRFEVLP